jgi:hypothetical protein
MKTKSLLHMAAMAVSLLMGSCTKEELTPRELTLREKEAQSVTSNFGSDLTFDHNKYTQYIFAALKDKTVGFAALIVKENNEMSGITMGMAAEPGPSVDPNAPIPSEFFFYSRRMETMQLSSTLTAATLLKVMELKGGAVTVDSPIIPYLPANWKIGPNIKLLTFRHLLSNNSGLAPQQLGLSEPESDTYDNLRKLIANGIPPSYIQDRNGTQVIVDNRKLSVNYALMRILIPYVQHGTAKYKFNEIKGTNAEATSTDYVSIVTGHVLKPSGIVPIFNNDFTMPDVVPTAETPYTRYYQFGNTNNSWEQDALGRLYCGANRWFMSVDDYTLFLNKLWTGKLLYNSSLEILKGGQMGMTFLYGKYGKYYYQKGFAVKNGAGLTTIWMTYPNGIRIVLFMNTVGGLATDSNGTPDLQGIVEKAYDNAWVATQPVQ